MTHYERLGIPVDASPAEVQRAFRRAARALHPDRHGERTTPEMAAVNEAWWVLSDPARRAAYDATFRPEHSTPLPTVAPPAPVHPDDSPEDAGTWAQESVRPYPPSGVISGFRLLFVGWIVLAVAILGMLFLYGFCRSGVGA